MQAFTGCHLYCLNPDISLPMTPARDLYKEKGEKISSKKEKASENLKPFPFLVCSCKVGAVRNLKQVHRNTYSKIFYFRKLVERSLKIL